MSFSLLPRFMTPQLTDVTLDFLEEHGIRLLMLDFDNTIVPYTTSIPAEKMQQWLEMMASSSISVCVVSNSKKDRVCKFCDEYGIICITYAKKPFTKGIKAALSRFAVPADAAALVGDQIFTDTLGGNCAGVSTILVKAIDNHNFWLKARHVLEKPFIFAARKRRISK